MSDPDVVIVGAGTAGCAAALAFARRGARVMVLDAARAPVPRLVGEWLHPAGVAALRRLGITNIASQGVTGTGFVVHPADGGEAITLPYPDGATSLGIAHHRLLGRLHEAVQDHPEVEFLQGVHGRVTGQGHVEINGQGRGRTRRIRTGIVIGADGRSSRVREFLGATDTHFTPSRTAGVLLEDVELVQPGYGRVLLGGPGPVLAYHIGPSSVRLCLDVQLTHPRPPVLYDYLWHGYHRAVPEELRPALRRSLRAGRVQWAANRCLLRTSYGAGRTALIGDAVGSTHPLTASGMTMGLLDAEALAHCDGRVPDYFRRRAASAKVSERLALAVHRALTGHDPATTVLRQALYRVWRDSDAERRRTMRLLGMQDSASASLYGAAAHILRAAATDTVGAIRSTGQFTHVTQTLPGLMGWLTWLHRSSATITPPAFRPVNRIAVLSP